MSFHRYAFTLGLLIAAAPTMGQITNGGFESAATTPPTTGDWQYNNGALRDSLLVHSGSFAADLNNTTPGKNVNVLEQTPAGSITPGTAYTLSYYAQATYGVAGEGQLQVGFMDVNGNYLAGYPSFTQIPSSANYTLGTRSLTAPAGASAFFIAFNAVTGAVTGSSSHLFIDDVSLAGAPEPATLASLGLVASTLIRRRRTA